MDGSSPLSNFSPGKRPFANFDSPGTNHFKKRHGSLSNRELDSRVQIMNDPIHGFIELHPLLVKIIHTPQFQRLKDIKQLGVCYWVFPGASHNRFEHCLGTSYLCGKMIDTLRELHRDEFEITENEALCVKIAGLCHDLGHGPFSHFFDGVFIPRAKPGSLWQHEDASCALFDFMMDSKNNPGLSETFAAFGLGENDKTFIKELFHGKNPETDTVQRVCSKSGKSKWFLYEIVSNKRNGIDCDKFDYFARDCFNVGVSSNFDCRRYFQNVRIIPVDNQLQICVRDKEVFNLYELFHTRWSLHHRVYQHKTHAAIEHLLCEALLKVDEKLKLSSAIYDMDRYWKLTDSIIYDILRNDSGDEDIREAQRLIQRIQRRELCKFCGQTQQLDPNEECPSEIKIAKKMAEKSEGALEHSQILVSIININFGMKHRDPIDSVVFFNKSYQPLKVRKEQVSQLLPQKFHERYVRVYAKSREDTEMVENCFEAWCRENEYPVPHMLEGDRTGYFSPAFKTIPGSQDTMKVPATSKINPRNLTKEFQEF